MSEYDAFYAAQDPFSPAVQECLQEHAIPRPRAPDWTMFAAGALTMAAVGGIAVLALSGSESRAAFPPPPAPPTPTPPSPPMSPEVAAAARTAQNLINLAADAGAADNEARNAALKAAKLMQKHGLEPRPNGACPG